MKIRTIKANQFGTKTIEARVPELSDIENLKVGDMAPDCFGGMSRVTRIAYRGKDINGRAFVCYVAAMSERDTPQNGCGCSATMKVWELVRTVAMGGVLNSAAADRIEAEMQAA